MSLQEHPSPTDGSALPWILEHLLAYPGSYEIPLRTMYTNNVLAQSHFPGTPSLYTGSSTDNSPTSPHSSHFAESGRQSAQSATEHFKTCLMEQISHLPSQPFSLPPTFITSFVRRCFSEELHLVDFTQALTALDYLKDLENRRKRELTAVLHRLGVSKEVLLQPDDERNRLYPGLSEWYISMGDKERKVEALYTQVYIGLRRWTLINEMRLEPFSKPNCVAMLNTLYPPTSISPPTAQLTATILASQRHAFFRYIQAVEKNGKDVLTNLENQSRRPGDPNGWAVVREIVDKYLRMANSVIEECTAIQGLDDFEAQSANGKRADSGISFATNDRPTTREGKPVATTTTVLNERSMNKSLPPAPVLHYEKKKTESTLERIVRRFKARNSDPKDETDIKPWQKDERKSLKKMKSASALGRVGSSTKKDKSHSRGGSAERAHLFDLEAERTRLIMEARKEKENRAPKAVGGDEKNGRMDWSG